MIKKRIVYIVSVPHAFCMYMKLLRPHLRCLLASCCSTRSLCLYCAVYLCLILESETLAFWQWLHYPQGLMCALSNTNWALVLVSVTLRSDHCSVWGLSFPVARAFSEMWADFHFILPDLDYSEALIIPGLKYGYSCFHSRAWVCIALTTKATFTLFLRWTMIIH